MSQALFNEALTRDMSTQTAPAPQTTSIVDIENEEDERLKERKDEDGGKTSAKTLD